MYSRKIKTKLLGQVGLKLCCYDLVLYIDPYLSNYVETQEGSEFKRLVPVRASPSSITDADYVLLTHAHIDHCDPETIIPLSVSSPRCQFVCSRLVGNLLIEWGIEENRLIINSDGVIDISREIKLHTVPSAHPTIVPLPDGGWAAVGYVLEMANKYIIYHAGDTSVDKLLIKHMKAFNGIDVAFMPVNERNYYRDKEGIIGNMTIREAFQMAVDIGVKTFVPTHWDMFESNQVYKEEIELLYKKIKPPFELSFYPEYL